MIKPAEILTNQGMKLILCEILNFFLDTCGTEKHVDWLI